MKKVNLKTLILSQLIFLSVIAKANAIQIGDFYYELDTDNNNAEVIYSGATYKGNITIPSTIEYENVLYNVISIGKEAFYNQRQLNAIQLPNSLTSIGDKAFINVLRFQQLTFLTTLKKLALVLFVVAVVWTTSLSVKKLQQ